MNLLSYFTILVIKYGLGMVCKAEKHMLRQEKDSYLPKSLISAEVVL